MVEIVVNRMFWIVALSGVLAFSSCENKSTEEAAEETVEEAAGPSGDSPHVDTNRPAFKAAGKAAAEIEGKQADRNAAADEAMNAGK